MAGGPLAADPANPSKKRRVLSDDEVISLAKEGRFKPSCIIMAVEDETGFCWFKRIGTNPSTATSPKAPSPERALRELTKTEVSRRRDATTSGPIESNDNVQTQSNVETECNDNAVMESNGNARNRQRAIAKVAKMRRFTAPVQALQAIVEQQELSGVGPEDVGSEKGGDGASRKKKRKKRKVRRKKKVICYETKREMVRKKVHKKKRVLRKKTVQFVTIRMTEGWEEAAVPDFPPPQMPLSVRRWLKGPAVPFAAVQEVELSLLDGFVMPLAKCYGDDGGKLSFITRTVLQWLMELRGDIEAMVTAVDVERVRVPITSALTANIDAAGTPAVAATATTTSKHGEDSGFSAKWKTLSF